jgi:D-inositol-3-phosphate glycosyltransferase
LPFVVDDGATGFLVDGHDPKAHAARVLDVLRDADLQARFGIEAAYRALRFTWDGTADEVARVYREVAAA